MDTLPNSNLGITSWGKGSQGTVPASGYLTDRARVLRKLQGAREMVAALLFITVWSLQSFQLMGKGFRIRGQGNWGRFFWLSLFFPSVH